MSSHDFGGLWTAQKLDILREYLEFFPIALGGRFKLVYIDTFAGTGKCTIKTGPDGKETIEGSATIALNVAQTCSRFAPVERRPSLRR
jgi:three-Cys-motif partner protein